MNSQTHKTIFINTQWQDNLVAVKTITLLSSEPNCVDRPPSHIPRVTTVQDDRRTRLLRLRNCVVPATETARTSLGCRVSETAGTWIDRNNLLNRARAHIRRALRQWNNVLFTDQSSFWLSDTRWWESSSLETSGWTLCDILRRWRGPF